MSVPILSQNQFEIRNFLLKSGIKNILKLLQFDQNLHKTKENFSQQSIICLKQNKFLYFFNNLV